MNSTCCKFYSGKRSHFFVSVDLTLSQKSDNSKKPPAASRAKSTSQSRVQRYWVKSHPAVIQLNIAAALTREALTLFYYREQVCLSVVIGHSSSLFHACLWIWRPSQTNKFCFCLEQFSKRRATSAINYISAIKVPTSDLGWPAQPRSPDFCIDRSFGLNSHSRERSIRKGRGKTTGSTGRSRLLKVRGRFRARLAGWREDAMKQTHSPVPSFLSVSVLFWLQDGASGCVVMGDGSLHLPLLSLAHLHHALSEGPPPPPTLLDPLHHPDNPCPLLHT